MTSELVQDLERVHDLLNENCCRTTGLAKQEWQFVSDRQEAMRVAMKAARRIEALEREKAELRDGFKASQDAVFALTRDLTAAEAERDRLREALEKIAGYDGTAGLTARAALEATNG